MMAKTSSDMKNPGCLWAVGAFFGFLVIAYLATRWLQPERLSDVQHCLGPYTGGEPPLQNTCDFPVNGELCLYGEAGTDICRTLTLAPGDGFERTAIDEDLRQLDGLLRAETYACKLPFMPGMVVDPNTKQLKQGCLPEGEKRE